MVAIASARWKYAAIVLQPQSEDKHYGLKVTAKVEECGNDFHAITAGRRVKHPQ